MSKYFPRKRLVFCRKNWYNNLIDSEEVNNMELIKSAIEGLGFIVNTLPALKAFAVGMYNLIASNAMLSLLFVLDIVILIVKKVSHSR